MSSGGAEAVHVLEVLLEGGALEQLYAAAGTPSAGVLWEWQASDRFAQLGDEGEPAPVVALELAEAGHDVVGVHVVIESRGADG